jgi:hypothetical protein
MTRSKTDKFERETSDKGFPAFLFSPFSATETVKAEKKMGALNFLPMGERDG